MTEVTLLLHNIRSIHNVGSIIRSANGFGVRSFVFSGYTPYPRVPHDTRLPHLSESITDRIHKTALGAELELEATYTEFPDLEQFKRDGYRVVGLEQDEKSVMLRDYKPATKTLLVLGEEVEGIAAELRKQCDDFIEIPMHGTKESFNVSVAAAIALYELTS